MTLVLFNFFFITLHLSFFSQSGRPLYFSIQGIVFLSMTVPLLIFAESIFRRRGLKVAQLSMLKYSHDPLFPDSDITDGKDCKRGMWLSCSRFRDRDLIVLAWARLLAAGTEQTELTLSLLTYGCAIYAFRVTNMFYGLYRPPYQISQALTL